MSPIKIKAISNFQRITKMEVDDEGIKTCLGFRSCFSRRSLVGLLNGIIGNSATFLVIIPKVTNQLGSDERKRVYRISGGILAVERAQ